MSETVHDKGKVTVLLSKLIIIIILTGAKVIWQTATLLTGGAFGYSVNRRPGMRSADSVKLHVPRTQTSFSDRSFAISGPRTWNNLPDAI